MKQLLHCKFSIINLITIYLTVLIHLTESTLPPYACDTTNPSTGSNPFCKTNLSIPQRAEDLVSRLTVDEKVTQLVNSATGIPRLGIPAYEWWSEALHGVAEIVYPGVPQGIRFSGAIRSATSFPQVILSVATFDRKLWYTIGQAESTRPPFACASSRNPFPFCISTRSIRLRTHDLISRLTVDEKVAQLVNTAPAIPRLGVPAYQWWNEALHGLVGFYETGVTFEGSISSATSFPQVILTAATFDKKLWYHIGQAVGREARAVYNAGQATGLTFWAPNINIFRDPRWGRGQETPGEDPLVASNYAVSYVRGLQGDSFEGGQLKDGHLLASACCKHFTAYDLDDWNNVDRYKFNAIVNKQDLADSYQPPFQSCVEKGRASGIMCAYNQVNGVPNCADHNLLTNTARKQWGFRGYIVSDCDAVKIIHENQGYAKEPEDAVANVLKAGMDVNCGSYLKNYTKSALEQKKITESDIDRALHNLFSIRMRLGLFNGNPTTLLYGNIGANQVCTKEHQALALEAARNGIVLLKNENKILPFSKTKIASLAVIGPNANVPKTLQGNYEGPPCIVVSPLQALQVYVKNTVYQSGCKAINCTSDTGISKAVEVAKGADHVVLIVGLDQTWERESHDREDLVLPGHQQSLIECVANAAKKPVVLVLICGGPLDVSFAKTNPKIGAIVWAGYPGEAGGFAIAEVLFGEHNPGGKLPVTWYPKDFTKVAMTDMRMRSDPSSGYPGRTYRFYKGPKVFEFGYGLSYTKYTYNFASHTKNNLNLNQLFTTQQVKGPMLVSEISPNQCEKSKFSAFVGVHNSGDMDGKHPVLLFIRHVNPSNGSAIKQLVGFESVHLKTGERVEVEFELNPCEHFSRANEDGLMVIEEGLRFLSVGDVEYPISVQV